MNNYILFRLNGTYNGDKAYINSHINYRIMRKSEILRPHIDIYYILAEFSTFKTVF